MVIVLILVDEQMFLSNKRIATMKSVFKFVF